MSFKVGDSVQVSTRYGIAYGVVEEIVDGRVFVRGKMGAFWAKTDAVKKDERVEE